MNDRLSMPGAMPADLAEVLSDVSVQRDRLCADPRTTDALYEVICDSDALKDFLEDEELAGPLSGMVELLPRCIAELADMREKPACYQSMLRFVAQAERVLVSYVEGDA